MTTAASIIIQALKDIQVLDESETPSASLMQDSFDTLNQMLALWQTDKMYVYAQTTSSIAATGATSYTVGTGGNFNITAPTAINSVFYSNNSVDYRVPQLATLEEYQDISYKNIKGFPDIAYYNNTFPLSVLYLYPYPQTGTINIVYSTKLPSYTSTADAISLPGEYELALRFSLAELLCIMMAKQERPDIAQKAAGFRKMIKRENIRINKLDLGGTRLGHLATFFNG